MVCGLREEICGGHRRKPPSEANDEEEVDSGIAAINGDPPAFMLSSLRPPTGKFVLGPPVESEPPVVVFTGPPDHPDAVQNETRAKQKRVRSHRRPKKVGSAKR